MPQLHQYLSKNRCFLCMLFFVSFVFAQNETNYWYFGDNAGMNFSNGDFSILNDGSMQTPAGCSSISDRDGNLMFYTNGQTVWNRNHQIMENGTDLATEIENVQTSIIIPRPNNENSYYIFTIKTTQTNTPHLTPTGLYFSEVVFSDQYPLGYVYTKNTRILDKLTGRLAAIHHAPTNTIRLVTFGHKDYLPSLPPGELPVAAPDSQINSPLGSADTGNVFKIFNITEEGIQYPAIFIETEEYLEPIGAMKVSPNGEYIAIADNFRRYIFLYNFDNDNLTIELEKRINSDIPFTQLSPYGVEFSPNSKILYYSASGVLVQYEINQENEHAIVQRTPLPGADIASLQLARNGKIYVARGGDEESFQKIGVVNKPDKLAENSNFQFIQVDLESGSSQKGLPIFIASYFRNRIITEDYCEDQLFNFKLDAYAPVESVSWDFGDGMTSSSIEPNHYFSEAGVHKVSATVMINNYPVILYKDVEVYPLPSLEANQTLQQCDLDNDGISTFNLETIGNKMNNPNSNYVYYFYNTLTDLENETNQIENAHIYENIANPQEIFVKIESPYGCTSMSSFFIESTYVEIGDVASMYMCDDSDNVPNNNQGNFNLVEKEQEIRNQFEIPETSTVTFYGSVQDVQTKENKLPRYYISESTTIWVRVEDENYECNGIVSFNLVVNTPELNIEDHYVICSRKLQPLTLLDGGGSNDKWEWKNSSGTIISTARQFALTEIGTFSVTVYKTENGLECSNSKIFVVDQAGTPEFLDIITDNNEISVSIIGNSIYEFSLDGNVFFGQGDSYTFTPIETGFYIIYVRDIYNCEPLISKEVFLLNFPKFFTPNQDGTNDYWRISPLSMRLYSEIEIYIYDRYGKLLHYINVGKNAFGWDGKYKGKQLPSSDYWFKAILKDNSGTTTIRKGHFSLIR